MKYMSSRLKNTNEAQVGVIDQPIITIGKARKILGSEAKDMSDDQVKDLVSTLTEVAVRFLQY